MGRSASFEHDFLDEACRGAGLVAVGLTELAEARLALGEGLYGDRSLKLPLGELVDNIEEEVVDEPCWSLILLQSDEFQALDDDRRMAAMSLLESAASLAAQQMWLVRELRQTLKC